MWELYLKPQKGDYNSREKIARDLPSNVLFFYSLIVSFFYFFFDAYPEIFASRASRRIGKQTRPTAEADLSLRAMLWCIIPKWMVNGLCDRHGVKAFFSEIVAEIRSIVSNLATFAILGHSEGDKKDERCNKDDNYNYYNILN